jgi:hypothetical protein
VIVVSPPFMVDDGVFHYHLWMYDDGRWELNVIAPAARLILVVHVDVSKKDPFGDRSTVTYPC